MEFEVPACNLMRQVDRWQMPLPICRHQQEASLLGVACRHVHAKKLHFYFFLYCFFLWCMEAQPVSVTPIVACRRQQVANLFVNAAALQRLVSLTQAELPCTTGNDL